MKVQHHLLIASVLLSSFSFAADGGKKKQHQPKRKNTSIKPTWMHR